MLNDFIVIPEILLFVHTNFVPLYILTLCTLKAKISYKLNFLDTYLVFTKMKKIIFFLSRRFINFRFVKNKKNKDE